jgi:hypothetical protein
VKQPPQEMLASGAREVLPPFFYVPFLVQTFLYNGIKGGIFMWLLAVLFFVIGFLETIFKNNT